MELKQAWQQMNAARDDKNWPDMGELPELAPRRPLSPLQQLKKKLVISLCWIIIITLVYGYAFYFFDLIYVRAGLVLIMLYNLFSGWQTFVLYKSTEPLVQPGNSLKKELERNCFNIYTWCRLQERNALFVYPVSISSGFIAGLSPGNGAKLNLIIHKPMFWIALAICLVVLVPLCFLLARQMMKYTYGKQLQHLNELIAQLENTNGGL